MRRRGEPARSARVRFLRAAKAAVARPSWIKRRAALKTSRAAITAASTYAPMPTWRTIAASRIHGTGPQYFAKKVRQRGAASSPTAFGPNSASRRGASAFVKPVAAAEVTGISIDEQPVQVGIARPVLAG
jgi:hypothetical protein